MSKTRDFTAAKRFHGTAKRPMANSMKQLYSVSLNSENMKRPSLHFAVLSQSTVEVIRPLMQSLRDDGVLIPCKVAGLSWETVSAILESRFAAGSMGPNELEKARGQFARINKWTTPAAC